MKIRIEDFETCDLKESRYIHPKLAIYKQNGESRSWEILESADSVAILLYHREYDSFLFVRQFRPALYARNSDGMTVELCAGLVDKELPLCRIASEEIEEECGYRVDPSALEKLGTFHTCVGYSGSRQTLYYAEIEESMKVGEGGGIDGEDIELLFVSIKEAKRFIFDDTIARTPGLMFAVTWWFCDREPPDDY